MRSRQAARKAVWKCPDAYTRGVARSHTTLPQVDAEGNIIDSCFKTFGCGSAIASSSVATEWVKGQTLDNATDIKNSDIAKHLSLPPVKLHCSMLAEDAIKVRSCARSHALWAGCRLILPLFGI